MPSVIVPVRGTSNCSTSARRFPSCVSTSDRARRAWPRIRSIRIASAPMTNDQTASSASMRISPSRSGA